MHYTLDCKEQVYHTPRNMHAPVEFSPLLSLVGLIYKEVSEWEEWKKNGVIRGQPPPLGE